MVQLFIKDGGQWGEIFRGPNGKLAIELYQQADGQPWCLDLEELRKVIDLSIGELKSKLEDVR